MIKKSFYNNWYFFMKWVARGFVSFFYHSTNDTHSLFNDYLSKEKSSFKNGISDGKYKLNVNATDDPGLRKSNSNC